MDISEMDVDDLVEDWKYWKEMYYDVALKYKLLMKKYEETLEKLFTEMEKTKMDAFTIRELRERLKKLNAYPPLSKKNSGSSHHAQGSSDLDSISSYAKVKESIGNTKLYEAFLILSGDSEEANIIYAYSNSDILQLINSKIINDFIFPTQMSGKNLEIHSISELSVILYPNFIRDTNSFVFTLKGNSSSSIKIDSIPNKNKELLYCCCVVTEDLQVKETSRVESSYLCYCILTYCPCFELHFDVIYRLLSIKRIERTNKVMELESTYTLQHLLDILKEKGPSSEEIYVLETYGVYNIQPSLNVRIDISEVEPVEYEFPQDLSMIDTVWPCPVLFSLMKFSDLMTCIFALLQENSIVFMSKSLGVVSSCVLGIQSLLKPFTWAYVISPILPEQIKDILQAPLPLLVGVPFVIDKQSGEILYVDLDKGTMTDKHVPMPYYNALAEKCRKDYGFFAGRTCYTPTDIQQVACFRIIDSIKMYLQDLGERLSKSPDAVGEAARKADANEQEFFKRFTQTQTFLRYYSE